MQRILWLVALAPLACTRPGVSPALGRASGGQHVRITDDDLASHGPPVAYFGDRAAKSVVVQSDRLVTVTTPEADAPGVVDVELRFEDGTSRTYPAAYRYDDRAVVLRTPAQR